MATGKDSRLRTVQREYGKVFVVVFGVKYQPPADGSALKVGDEVMVVEGSKIDSVTFLRPSDGTVDRHWRAYGYVGGAKAKDKAIADWAKFTAGEKSIGMKREATQEDPHKPSDLEVLAKDYEAVEVVEVIAVRFRGREQASSFRLSAGRRGWKVSEPLTDENSGQSVLLVRSK